MQCQSGTEPTQLGSLGEENKVAETRENLKSYGIPRHQHIMYHWTKERTSAGRESCNSHPRWSLSNGAWPEWGLITSNRGKIKTDGKLAAERPRQSHVPDKGLSAR